MLMLMFGILFGFIGLMLDLVLSMVWGLLRLAFSISPFILAYFVLRSILY